MRLIGFSKVSAVCMDGFWERTTDSHDREYQRPAIRCVKCRATTDEKDTIITDIFEEHLQFHLNQGHILAVGEGLVHKDTIIKDGKKFLSQKVVWTHPVNV